MKIHGSIHVLAVPDLKRSTEYYRDKLGLTLTWGDHNWSFMRREGFAVMLGECKNAIDPKELGDHQYFAYVEVEGIDELCKEFTENAVYFTSEIADKEWGQREFGIKTIDGHRIMFGEEIRV